MYFTTLYIINSNHFTAVKIKFFVLTAGNIFWPISQVMGVINEFGFRCFASFTDALTAG